MLGTQVFVNIDDILTHSVTELTYPSRQESPQTTLGQPPVCESREMSVSPKQHHPPGIPDQCRGGKEMNEGKVAVVKN